MSEAREHTDDEIVTFNEIDLQHEYDKFNALLFGGSLPNVNLSWNNNKGRHGMVRSVVNKFSKKPIRIEGLYMSKYFKITYRKFKDIFAHEMIHVKNIDDAIKLNIPRYRGDAHGYEFMREANRINSMGLGFNITDKEYESIDVSDHVRGRNIYIGVLKVRGAKNGDFIIAMTPAAYAQRKELESIFDYNIKRGKYKNVEIKYYNTNSPHFLKFSVQRNFNTNVRYKPATENDLLKVGELGQELDVYRAGESSISTPSSFEPRRPEPTPEPRRPEPRIEPKRPEPRVEPRKPEPIKPEVSDEMKEVNRKVMSIFKNISDKSAQEKLFDILKTSDPIRKQIKIDNYNQMLGPKYGFI